MNRKCKKCNKEFSVPLGWRVFYCSSWCRVADGDLFFKGCNPYQSQRKARAKAILDGDSIDAVAVYEHYNWMCFGCKQQINKTLRNPNPMSATIDHVVPICAGGKHVWDNVVPMHKKCNEKKNKEYHSQQQR